MTASAPTSSPAPTRPPVKRPPRRKDATPVWAKAIIIFLGVCAIAIGTIDVWSYLHRGASDTTRAAGATAGAAPSEHFDGVPPVVRPLGGAGTNPYGSASARPTTSHPRTTSAATAGQTSQPTPTDANGIPLAVLGASCTPSQTYLRRYDSAGALLVCDGRSWVEYQPVTGASQTATDSVTSRIGTSSAAPSGTSSSVPTSATTTAPTSSASDITTEAEGTTTSPTS